MAFAAEVKSELCRVPIQRRCCARAEAYGILLYANRFTSDEVRIVTENSAFVKRLPLLFQKAFQMDFDQLPSLKEEISGKQVFQILQKEKIHALINHLGFDPRQSAVLHINFGLLEERCCQDAFLRGAFLAGGSVTDPKKCYHLELVTGHTKVSREMEVLLGEMGYQARSTLRNGNQVIYFKQSRIIEELLTRAGAPVCALEVMTAKVEKDLSNQVNRRVNCETANVDKAVDAAQQQISAIRRLAEAGVLETLSQTLQETAIARMYYPEFTLQELADSFDPPISKSCLNHRMRKLMSLAKEPPSQA